MTTPLDLKRIDELLDQVGRITEELLILRAEISVAAPAKADDDEMIDTATAAERCGIQPDTARWLARDKGLGKKQGGRWLISMRVLRRHYGL